MGANRSDMQAVVNTATATAIALAAVLALGVPAAAFFAGHAGPVPTSAPTSAPAGAHHGSDETPVPDPDRVSDQEPKAPHSAAATPVQTEPDGAVISGRDGDGEQAAPDSAEESGRAQITHAVQSGDTLTSIAGQYDVSVATLVQVNQIENPDLIYPGDTLIVG